MDAVGLDAFGAGIRGSAISGARLDEGRRITRFEQIELGVLLKIRMGRHP